MSIINLPEHNVEVVPLPKAFHAPNGYIHAGQVEAEAFPGNAALSAASAALGYGREEAEAINELRANPDDEDRAATHDRKVRERIDNFERTFAERFDNAKAGVENELKRTEADLVEAAGLKPNSAHFDAITSAFHQMKPEQRAATIAELIDQGDHASLATLIDAPLFLTGLTAEVRDSIRERVFHKVNPQAVKLRDHLKVVLKRIDEAGYVAPSMFGQLRSGTGPGEWKNRSKMAAAKAAANFQS